MAVQREKHKSSMPCYDGDDGRRSGGAVNSVEEQLLGLLKSSDSSLGVDQGRLQRVDASTRLDSARLVVIHELP